MEQVSDLTGNLQVCRCEKRLPPHKKAELKQRSQLGLFSLMFYFARYVLTSSCSSSSRSMRVISVRALL